MPNSKYTSDLIIATGNISKSYAQNYITPLALYIMQDDLWRNQIEQINILPDLSVELVPRVGDHIVLLGNLPKSADKQRRNKEIDEFLAFKLKRLEKFYKYGLSQIGWNRYNYINMEFDNQIICKRNAEFDSDEHQPKTQIYNEADSPRKKHLPGRRFSFRQRALSRILQQQGKADRKRRGFLHKRPTACRCPARKQSGTHTRRCTVGSF